MTKAILLLHGFATNKTDFDPIIDELNNLYDHVECHNLPGHNGEPRLKGFTAHATMKYVDNEISKLEKKYVNYNYQSKLQHIYDKLLALGFNKEIVQNALSNVEEKDENKERELLKNDLLKAKRKYAKVIDKNERNKRIISYLYKKGYSYYIISDELKDDENEN